MILEKTYTLKNPVNIGSEKIDSFTLKAPKGCHMSQVSFIQSAYIKCGMDCALKYKSEGGSKEETSSSENSVLSLFYLGAEDTLSKVWDNLKTILLTTGVHGVCFTSTNKILTSSMLDSLYYEDCKGLMEVYVKNFLLPAEFVN